MTTVQSLHFLDEGMSMYEAIGDNVTSPNDDEIVMDNGEDFEK